MYEKFMASDDIITRKVKMPDGSEHETHWKKCPYYYFERWRRAEASENPAEAERAKQLYIAATLVNPDGTRALSEKDSIKLTAAGVSCLFPVALEVNDLVNRPDPKGDSPDGDGST